MPDSRRAVIDLGTNTFHLLIADVSPNGSISEVYRERIFVKLASEGIETIGPAPFQRGLDALRHFAGLLADYGVRQLTAFGTAALRTASNGDVFVHQAQLEAGIPIHLISGDEEARLITRGVLAAVPPLNERALVMDIGGGSTEFVIVSPEGVVWRRSFGIGVQVLTTRFHHSDPIAETEVRALHQFLRNQLAPLTERLEEYPTRHLIGAAGTFDVLADVLAEDQSATTPTSHHISQEKLRRLHLELLTSTRTERLALDWLPEQRVDMIVSATLLIDFLLDLAGIERISVSEWAMKEGILLEGV